MSQPLEDWVREAMRFIDLCDADAAGYDDLHEDAVRLTAEGYSLFGISLDASPESCLADLDHRQIAVLAETTAQDKAVIIWRPENHRIVAVSGQVDVGAVFPDLSGGPRWRWRCFVGGSTATLAMSGEGAVERSEAAARLALERAWSDFLDRAGLTFARAGTSGTPGDAAPTCRALTNECGALGECLLCDADQGEFCRKPLGDRLDGGCR